MSDDPHDRRRQLNVADFFKVSVGNSPQKPKRRRLRFSLRTLLLTMFFFTLLVWLATPLWRSGHLAIVVFLILLSLVPVLALALSNPHKRRWYQFRWHVLTAPIIGVFIAGPGAGPGIESVSGLLWVITTTAWGPWEPPLNLLYCVVTPLAITAFEVAKRTTPKFGRTCSIWQLTIWWAFWLLFGFALRFGRYVGP
ncbi:MAG: hypothetical protein IIA67_11160 [Planctomycetes bacterium]|nr:hypothetical protein [Planctomycetota bacterium]